MLVLRVEHHKTYIENATNSDLDIVRDALTVFKKKYKVSPYQAQEWEVTYLLALKDFSFPTAYLEEVKKFTEEKNIAIHITDKRKYPMPYLRLNLRQDLDLRQDQKDGYAMIRENKTGIVMMPTATGKSRIIAKTIDYRKVRTLIIVPRTNLQDQLAKLLKKSFGNSKVDIVIPFELKERIKMGLVRDEYEKFDEDHSLRKKSIYLDMDALSPTKEKMPKKSVFDEITMENPATKKIKFSMDMSALGQKNEDEAPENKYLKDKIQKKFLKFKDNQKFKKQDFFNQPIKYRDIYIFCDASLDSLPQEFLNQFEMVIIDECHHAAARLIRESLVKLKNAAYRYYFSATPWRDHSAEEKLLASAIGTNVIYELHPEEAIKYQSIAKPDFEMVESPEPKTFMKDKKKWRDILEFGIIGNETRNSRIVEDSLKDYDEGRNVFIAVDEITHVEILKERFLKQGITVDVIHGEIPRLINQKTIERVGDREKGICIGTMSVGEGTDMPNLDSVILASGGKSSIRFLQRIGRGARKGTDQDKTNFKVRDYFDWFHVTLMRHSMARKRIFEDYYKNFGE